MSKNDNPNFHDLEAVNNEFANRDYEINIKIAEFNCVCPRTGLPDFGAIHITYVPDKLIVELKSLKLYIVKFRNIGIFHEDVTNKILDDLQKALNPRKINVVGDFHPRGGIKTTINTGKL